MPTAAEHDSALRIRLRGWGVDDPEVAKALAHENQGGRNLPGRRAIVARAALAQPEAPATPADHPFRRRAVIRTTAHGQLRDSPGGPDPAPPLDHDLAEQASTTRRRPAAADRSREEITRHV